MRALLALAIAIASALYVATAASLMLTASIYGVLNVSINGSPVACIANESVTTNSSVATLIKVCSFSTVASTPITMFIPGGVGVRYSYTFVNGTSTISGSAWYLVICFVSNRLAGSTTIVTPPATLRITCAAKITPSPSPTPITTSSYIVIGSYPQIAVGIDMVVEVSTPANTTTTSETQSSTSSTPSFSPIQAKSFFLDMLPAIAGVVLVAAVAGYALRSGSLARY